jgi:hypothetical protein
MGKEEKEVLNVGCGFQQATRSKWTNGKTKIDKMEGKNTRKRKREPEKSKKEII